MALPLTTTSAPQPAISAALAMVTPPSTPTMTGRPASAARLRTAATRRRVFAAGGWPGQPGSTASTSTRSISSSSGSTAVTGVPGLIANPRSTGAGRAAASAVSSCRVRCGCRVASVCTVTTAGPAATMSGSSRRGSSTSRWASTGIPAAATAATKPGPTVSCGQNDPSMTSTCAQHPVPRRMASSSPSRVRSAVSTPALSLGPVRGMLIVPGINPPELLLR